MASAGGAVVRNDHDDSASLLVDKWSPSPAVTRPARSSSSPFRRLLHGGKSPQATTRPAAAGTRSSHDVKRFICSPFAAVFRAMSCARDAAVRTCDEQQQQPGNNGAAAAERRREAAMKRRPSLEQLLRMEAPPPPPPPYEAISSCAAAVKGKKEHQEPLFPSPRSHFVAAVSDERTTIVPEAAGATAAGGGPGRQTNNAKRLVVVLASLRACSRAPRINDGKVAPGGKAELFYYRPIPMGRRCRVQHLESSPAAYGATTSDLSSLLDLGLAGQM